MGCSKRYAPGGSPNPCDSLLPPTVPAAPAGRPCSGSALHLIPRERCVLGVGPAAKRGSAARVHRLVAREYKPPLLWRAKLMRTARACYRSVLSGESWCKNYACGLNFPKCTSFKDAPLPLCRQTCVDCFRTCTPGSWPRAVLHCAPLACPGSRRLSELKSWTVKQIGRFCHRGCTTHLAFQATKIGRGASSIKKFSMMHGLRHTSARLTTSSSMAADSVSFTFPLPLSSRSFRKWDQHSAK